MLTWKCGEHSNSCLFLVLKVVCSTFSWQCVYSILLFDMFKWKRLYFKACSSLQDIVRFTYLFHFNLLLHAQYG